MAKYECSRRFYRLRGCKSVPGADRVPPDCPTKADGADPRPHGLNIAADFLFLRFLSFEVPYLHTFLPLLDHDQDDYGLPSGYDTRLAKMADENGIKSHTCFQEGNPEQ